MIVDTLVTSLGSLFKFCSASGLRWGLHPPDLHYRLVLHARHGLPFTFKHLLQSMILCLLWLHSVNKLPKYLLISFDDRYHLSTVHYITCLPSYIITNFYEKLTILMSVILHIVCCAKTIFSRPYLGNGQVIGMCCHPSVRLFVCLSVCHRCIVANRCKIGPRLLLITDRKSYSGFQMRYKSLTLDDLEES